MRRTFLGWRELPALWLGVARGRPAALRRVIGARYGGRAGLVLGALGLLLGVRPALWPWLVAAQLAIAMPAARLARPPLAWLAYQRVSLWLAGSALVLCAALALLGARADAWTVALWLGAHAWLVLCLRRGWGERDR